MTRWWTGLDPGSLLAILALATYLTTAGGHAYSTDGTFAYEMAKSAVLDPEHQYWGRFRSAFARWGVGMPAFAQPFVLGGAALGTLAPERDDIVISGKCDATCTVLKHVSHIGRVGKVQQQQHVEYGGAEGHALPTPPDAISVSLQRFA